ncbi:MAG: hypothetical protein Q8L53_16875 [Aestuariivirga sp.]|nr:hypothetical protein [Aestuariivirga sp.]
MIASYAFQESFEDKFSRIEARAFCGYATDEELEWLNETRRNIALKSQIKSAAEAKP